VALYHEMLKHLPPIHLRKNEKIDLILSIMAVERNTRHLITPSKQEAETLYLSLMKCNSAKDLPFLLHYEMFMSYVAQKHVPAALAALQHCREAKDYKASKSMPLRALFSLLAADSEISDVFILGIYQDWMHSSFAFTHCMQALIESDRLELARKLMVDVKKTNQVTQVSMMIPSFVKKICETGREDDVLQAQRMINSYVQSKRREALQNQTAADISVNGTVFDSSTVENIRSMYKALLFAHSEHSDSLGMHWSRSALLIFRDMLDLGIRPQSHEANVMIGICSRANNFGIPPRIFHHVMRHTALAIPSIYLDKIAENDKKCNVSENELIFRSLIEPLTRCYQIAVTGDPQSIMGINILFAHFIDWMGFHGSTPLLMHYFNLLQRHCTLLPNEPLELNHYNSFVEALARHRKYQEAWECILLAEAIGKRTRRWQQVTAKTVGSLLPLLMNEDPALYRQVRRRIEQHWPHILQPIHRDNKD
jgi:hypothetical protein